MYLVSVKTREVRGEGRKGEGGRERRKQGYKAGRKPHNYNCSDLQNKCTQKCQLLNGTRIKYAQKEVTGKTLKGFRTSHAE